MQNLPTTKNDQNAQTVANAAATGIINIETQLNAAAAIASASANAGAVGELATVTTIGAISAAAAVAAYKRITNLADAREQWQNGVFKTANDGLYSLLADCYRVYNDMLGKSNAAARLRDALAHAVAEKNLTFKASTHSVDRLIRVVFGEADRRRVSAYSVAIRAALAAKPQVGPDAFADFVRDAGGIEEVRAAASKKGTGLSPKEKAEVAAAAVTAGTSAVIVSDPIFCADLDAAKVSQFHLLVAEQLADSTLAIKAIVSNAAVVNAALQAYYSTNKDDLQTAKVTAAAATTAVATTEAFQAARDAALAIAA
jgi:hypothetical protein